LPREGTFRKSLQIHHFTTRTAILTSKEMNPHDKTLKRLRNLFEPLTLDCPKTVQKGTFRISNPRTAVLGKVEESSCTLNPGLSEDCSEGNLQNLKSQNHSSGSEKK